jgi:hypothetical protein
MDALPRNGDVLIGRQFVLRLALGVVPQHAFDGRGQRSRTEPFAQAGRYSGSSTSAAHAAFASVVALFSEPGRRPPGFLPIAIYLALF